MSPGISQPVVEPPTLKASGSQWIISRTEDTVWFLGSALISYLALGSMALGFPLVPLLLIWLIGVDGPHVLATVTRTYCDKQERAKLGVLLWIPIPLLLVGPLMVAVGQGPLFFLFAVCWQHFHIVKQHFGFVMLYKAKNRERDPKDFFLDRWFLLSSLFVPLGLFVVRTRLDPSNLAPPFCLVAYNGDRGLRSPSLCVVVAAGAKATAWNRDELARRSLCWRSWFRSNGWHCSMLRITAPVELFGPVLC